MAKNPELIIKIGANDKEFKSAMDDLPNTAQKGLSSLQANILKVTAAGAVFGAIVTGTRAAVAEFKEFERGFSDVVTLLDKGSFSTKTFENGVEDLKNGVLALRAETGQSFDVLNKGLFDLVSAGVAAESAIDVLRVSTNLAIAGATDTSVAVDGITSAINAYGIEVERAQEVADKFFLAQKFGKTTVAELSQDFGKVASAAANVGVSFDELLASVSAVTLGGVRTNEAFTGLKAILAGIIKPTEEAKKEAEFLGIEFNTTALRAQGFQKFLEGITQSGGFTSTTMEKLFGSMEAVNFVMGLTGGQAEDFSKILSELGDEAGRQEVFADALATKNETLDQKYKKLDGTIQAFQVTLGQKAAPAFELFADVATDAIQRIDASVQTLDQDILRLQLSFARFVSESIFGVDALGQKYEELRAELSKETQNPFDLFAESQDVGKRGGKMIEEALAEKERVNRDLVEAERRKNLELEEEANKQAQREAERQAKKDAADAERKEAKREQDEQDYLDQLLLEEERFEGELERLNERLTGVDEAESQFAGLRELRELEALKKKARTAEQIKKIDMATAVAAEKYSEQQTRAVIDDLATVFDTSTALGKALFLVQKALAIADVIKTTQQASMLAYGSQLIVGDPSSIARAEAARLATIVRGAISAGAIAATSIAQVTGAKDGGIVKGGSFGRDSEPFLLAKDEIIVPSRLNPLSPNFDQSFGGGGMFGAQSVKVEVGLEENASRILTLKQREDRVLGIQR